MSTSTATATAPSPHAPGAHGRDHVPHVLPLTTYFAVWGALIAFTALTVAVSYVDFGAANLFIALAVATCKAAMVALVFMHLWWDHKFNSVVFVSSLVFLAIFIAFTMFDTEARGRADYIERERPRLFNQPFKDAYPDTTRMPAER